MKPTLVTCGITSFNASSTIERAVRSALAQTWRPIEIIIVDDCSSDESPAILETLQNKFPDVYVLRNERNLGVASSRNRILDSARGDFVAFFDDDDASEPRRLACQIARITQYEGKFGGGAPIVCHTARRQTFADGRVEVLPTMGEQSDCLAPNGLDVAHYILFGKSLGSSVGACATCSQMSRLSTYKALGGFDTHFRRSEDTEFNVRLGIAGAHFVGIAEPLVNQTMTHSSEKQLSEECRYALMLLEKHRDLFESNSQLAFCRRWIEGKYAWLEGRHDVAFTFAFLMLQHPIYSLERFLASRRHAAHNRSLRKFHKEPELSL